MKNKHSAYPLSICAFFATIATLSTLLTACDLNINQSSEASKSKIGTTPKTIRTISYLDNGAVVPFPVKQRVTFLIEDSTKIDMVYAEMAENREPTAEKWAISDPTRTMY